MHPGHTVLLLCMMGWSPLVWTGERYRTEGELPTTTLKLQIDCHEGMGSTLCMYYELVTSDLIPCLEVAVYSCIHSLDYVFTVLLSIFMKQLQQQRKEPTRFSSVIQQCRIAQPQRVQP